MDETLEQRHEAREALSWLRQISAARRKERERCYQIVYDALAKAETPEAIATLKDAAIKIVDPA